MILLILEYQEFYSVLINNCLRSGLPLMKEILSLRTGVSNQLEVLMGIISLQNILEHIIALKETHAQFFPLKDHLSMTICFLQFTISISPSGKLLLTIFRSQSLDPQIHLGLTIHVVLSHLLDQALFSFPRLMVSMCGTSMINRTDQACP